MKINLTKLKMGCWFEDEEGNVYTGHSPNLPKEKRYFTYHRVYPCTYRHEVDSYCFHPQYLHENNKLYQAMLHFDWFRRLIFKIHEKKNTPFTFKRAYGSEMTYGSKWSQECIVAMVNSGDYTLEEAIYIYCNSCERCMNVLLYKYLDGADGYEEGSEEWKKANTVCDFCRDMED